MSDECWLISVTAGRWQVHGIQQAMKAGLKVLAIDSDCSAPGLSIADIGLCLSLDNHASVVSAVTAQGKCFAGVVSFASEAGMPLAAYLRVALGLKGPDALLTNSLLNKVSQRKAWDRFGVPSVKWCSYTDSRAALVALQNADFPCIVKPADSSGSRGVTKIESIQDNLADAIERAFQFAKSSEILIESFMEGTEFTVETFAEGGCFHVLAVTEKKKVKGTRSTVASELASPARPVEVIDKITSVVVSAYRALGYREGPGHAEIILGNDGRVGLIEVAGRGGGFMVFDRLVPAISGYNIARATALQAVGLAVEPVSANRKSAVLRFFPSRPGILRSITGFDEANRINGVEADTFVKVGSSFKHAIADADRMGYILAVSDQPFEAQELADRAESSIHFQIEATN